MDSSQLRFDAGWTRQIFEWPVLTHGPLNICQRGIKDGHLELSAFAVLHDIGLYLATLGALSVVCLDLP